jgi:hypothetical protein
MPSLQDLNPPGRALTRAEALYGHRFVREIGVPSPQDGRVLTVFAGTGAGGSFDGIKLRHTKIVRLTPEQVERVREWPGSLANRVMFIAEEHEHLLRCSIGPHPVDGGCFLQNATIIRESGGRDE